MRKRTANIVLAMTMAMGMSLMAACGNSGGQEEGSKGTIESNGSSELTESSQTPETSRPESGESSSAEENYDGKLVSEGNMELEYAEGFSVELFKGGYRRITLADSGEQFLVVPEGMSVPEGLEESVSVLQMPVDHVYMASTGMVSLVDAIGALDHIKLVATDLDGWYIDNVVEAMNKGEISYSGNYKEPDYEMMVDKGIQLHIDTAMIDSCPEVTEKFTELGIPNMKEMSSKENHPLARVEWVKLTGVLFGKEAEAQAYFDNQKAMMEQATAKESSGISVAMGYITSSGKCYARNGGDYLVHMIGLAGGNYVCAEMEPQKSGNTSMTFEEWYAAFRDADYLFYWNLGNKFYSIQEMTEYEPLFADFKAVKEGHVWITSPDFSQATSAISSIAADMNTILFSENPDEVTTDHLIKLPLTSEN